MYLNTRTAPRRGILARIFLPFAASKPIFRRSVKEDSSNRLAVLGSSEDPISRTFTSTPPPGGKARVLSRANSQVRRAGGASLIGPAANPRGELIFNSRVSAIFREGYERYRSAFERRRSEKLEAKRRTGWRWWLYTGAGWGWWMKEIWKPPQSEYPTNPLPSPPHPSHARPAAVRPTAGRTRSGTATSIGSNASGASTEMGEMRSGDEGCGSRPTTPSRRAGTSRTTRSSKRTASGTALQQMQEQGLSMPVATLPEAPQRQDSNDSVASVASSTHSRIGSRSKRNSRETSVDTASRPERGRDATPSPVITSYMSLAPSSIPQSDTEGAGENTAPIASAVASTADDRADPLSTLREPELQPEKSSTTALGESKNVNTSAHQKHSRSGAVPAATDIVDPKK